nr:hypothetical protein [Tanacetum cinerariifolium]
AANKRKFEDTSQNNQIRQQPPKRQDVARAYAAGSGNRQQSPTNANVANNQRGNGAGQKVTCYECRAQGHFKRRLEMPLPEVCTVIEEMMKKLPVKDRWQLH